MRVPLSWLREYVDLPAGTSARGVAERLTAAGLKVESVEEHGSDLTGPLVIGQVVAYEEEQHSNGKTIRWCQVDVGEPEPRGIVCGARNFATGDRVVVALPGATLPGGFAITARRTYGHVSDGMICSSRELGIGDDHTGILVLPGAPEPGTEAAGFLGLTDQVLDIAVTPDRGYALSIRGIAREVATAYDSMLRDPADLPVPEADRAGYPVRVDDPERCDRFVARTVTGLDPKARSPLWLQTRLVRSGMRPVFLAVDVTNYVMLETGQPLHAYDRARLAGPIGVRRATAGERLHTLDGQLRELDPDDLLIVDDSGPIGVAGVMGGASTEISADTTDVVLEAAHFAPATVARSARRHKLPSEASRRFERGVDPGLPAVAAERAVRLLLEMGGATAEPGSTDVDLRAPTPAIALPLDLPTRLGGREFLPDVVVQRLEQVGCAVDVDGEVAAVVPPSWRPDLTQAYDLLEEVYRLEGYDTLPSVLPIAPAGRGHSAEQRLRRRVANALAGGGYVEVPAYPFVGSDAWEALGLPEGDDRRRAVRLANPLSDEEPYLRTTLLPGLLATLRRNLGRGASDVAVFETGLVFLPPEGGRVAAPRLGVDRRPTPEELAAVEAALPRQPRRLAVALAGQWSAPGWWGPGRPATWADAIEAVRTAARACGVQVTTRRAERAPWHPGRCAEVALGAVVIGHAGELHPKVLERLGLPPRTCAAEVDLDALVAAAPAVVPAPRLSNFPVAKEDVALVVAEDVPAADVEAALRLGAGDLLESLRLFDVYTGAQVGEGQRSLAYALRFRAPDRTLTVEEASAARDAAVAEAARRTGAVLRS